MLQTKYVTWQVPRMGLYVQWIEAINTLEAQDMTKKSGVISRTKVIQCIVSDIQSLSAGEYGFVAIYNHK